MKLLIAATLVLIANVHGQTGDPIGDCITGFFLNPNNTQLVTAIGTTCTSEGFDPSVLGTNDRAICDLAATSQCRIAFDQIFAPCGAPLMIFCSLPPGFEFPTAPPDQVACVEAAETARSSDIMATCGPGEILDVTTLAARCMNSACTTLLRSVYGSCGGFDPVTPVCSAFGGPTDTDPIGSCIENYFTNPSNIQALATLTMTCASENFNPAELATNNRALCDLSESSPCRLAFEAIFTPCGAPINVFCSLPADFEFPTPPPDQAACVENAEMASDNQIMTTCGAGEITDLTTLAAKCMNAECTTLLRNIYGACGGFDPVTPVCRAVGVPVGGSIRLYAVPVVVLISALLSILF